MLLLTRQEFDKKSNYLVHINRKYKCKQKALNPPNLINNSKNEENQADFLLLEEKIIKKLDLIKDSRLFI